MATEGDKIIWLKDKYEFLRLEGYARELGCTTSNFKIFEDGSIRVYMTGDRDNIQFAHYLMLRDIKRVDQLQHGKEIKDDM